MVLGDGWSAARAHTRRRVGDGEQAKVPIGTAGLGRDGDPERATSPVPREARPSDLEGARRDPSYLPSQRAVVDRSIIARSTTRPGVPGTANIAPSSGRVAPSPALRSVSPVRVCKGRVEDPLAQGGMVHCPVLSSMRGPTPPPGIWGGDPCAKGSLRHPCGIASRNVPFYATLRATHARRRAVDTTRALLCHYSARTPIEFWEGDLRGSNEVGRAAASDASVRGHPGVSEPETKNRGPRGLSP